MSAFGQNVEVIDGHEPNRPEPPLEGSEADTLLGFLDCQRATLEWSAKTLTRLV